MGALVPGIPRSFGLSPLAPAGEGGVSPFCRAGSLDKLSQPEPSGPAPALGCLILLHAPSPAAVWGGCLCPDLPWRCPPAPLARAGNTCEVFSQPLLTPGAVWRQHCLLSGKVTFCCCCCCR